jgi:hypothetical protein
MRSVPPVRRPSPWLLWAILPARFAVEGVLWERGRPDPNAI